MNLPSRFKSAARTLLRGETRSRRRSDLPPITAAEIAEIRQFFPRDKFFVLGHARSGTTLLARLLRLHPEVHCNWQAHFFTRPPFLKSLVNSPEMEEWLSRKSNRWNHGHDLSAVTMRAAADFIMERDALREGKHIVGDKSPSSLIHGQAVRDLAAVYPDAKIVYIVRDGRDVLISERFRNFVEGSKFLTSQDRQIMAALRRDPAPFMDGSRSIFTESFLRRAARGWVANLGETEAEGQRLFGKKYRALRFEDLLGDPLAEMTRLWKFLGVKKVGKSMRKAVRGEMSSNPDEEWQANRNEDIAAFLPKGQAGNWVRLFTIRDRAIFKEIAGDMLMKWKYEEGTSW